MKTSYKLALLALFPVPRFKVLSVVYDGVYLE